MPLPASPGRILFVSHDASRTGAPIVMLNFLRWLKLKGIFEFDIFLIRGGQIADKFNEIAPVFFPAKDSLLTRGIKKFLPNRFVKFFPGRLGEDKVIDLPAALKSKKFNLVYINTVDCLDVAGLLNATFMCPVICHVHENDFTINNFYREKVIALNLSNVAHFIAASGSTKTNLVEKYNLPDEKISLVYECIPLNEIKQPSVSKDEIRNELGLKDEFIVGGSGLTSWRKGVDLFVQLGAELDKLDTANNIKLLWIGNVHSEFKNQFEYEADRLKLKGKMIFTGVKPVIQNYFQIFDVFALTSREDPFPLVALEAAAQKKPIICFENSGGIPELLENSKAGVIVPYADVNAMARQILILAKDKNKAIMMGEEAETLVDRFDVDLIGKQLVTVISNIIDHQTHA